MSIERGATATVTHVVGEEHTAASVGSGDLAVLGTPVAIAWCEEATCAALDLDTASTSVGTRVSLEHLSASPVGTLVTVTAAVVAVDGRLVTFDVTARDDAQRLLAHGEIRRVVVDRERFLARVPPVEE